MATGRCNALLKCALLSAILFLLLPFVATSALAQGPIISAIRVQGNQRVETDAIRIHISQPVNAPLDPATVDKDIKAIYGMGFFDSVKAETAVEHGKNVLIYKVKERPQVTDVQIVGMKEFRTTNDKIVAATRIHPGSLLDPIRVKETEEGIQHVYEDRGYLDAKVSFRAIPGPGNTAVAQFIVNEGPRVYITRIEFTGNHAYSDSELKSQMETGTHNFLSWLTNSGVLDRKKLEDDADRIAAFYYNNGYLNVHVSEPQIIRHGDSITVKIAVDEGPRYKVGSVALAGDLKFPRAELEKLLTIKPGQDFSGMTLQHNVLTLSDFYSNRGYAFVNVQPKTQLNPADKTVAVTFDVNPGHIVLVNRIRITGNTKTSDKVIRREMQVQEQEPYSASAIRDSKKLLDQLGYFSSTRITTSPSQQPDKIDLNVHVTEANTASLQVAGGFDSYEGVFGQFTLGNTNLFGGGESVMLSAMIGYLYKNYSISYTEPWFLDIPLSVSTQLFDSDTYLFTFSQKNAGGSINTYYPLTQLGLKKIGPFSLKDVNAGLGYQFESVGITGLSPFTPLEIREFQGYTRVSELMPSIKRFTVDNPVDPRSGSIESLNLEFAGIGVGQPFVKGLLHWRWFYTFLKSPTWGSWVFSPSVTYGLGSTFSGPGDLPLYERFFPGGVGGEGDVRGYQLYSLGPLVTTYNKAGSPIGVTTVGGSKELLTDGMITFPILSGLGIRGMVFADAGQAYRLHQSMDLTNLQAAYGFGFQWRSPFGPLAIDIARPINPRPQDLSTVFEIGAGSPL